MNFSQARELLIKATPRCIISSTSKILLFIFIWVLPSSRYLISIMQLSFKTPRVSMVISEVLARVDAKSYGSLRSEPGQTLIGSHLN